MRKRLFMMTVWSLIVLTALPPCRVLASELILQYFGTSWNEIARRIPELAEAGYTALWLPPPFKAGAGAWSVGFDTYDRFDLGNKYQMGTVATKYGTETDLLHLMQMAHRFGFRVYFDNVMAHNGGPMSEGAPGTLQPNGFVPEDFHLIRTSETTYKNPDWPNWQDEWQVLHRNPFGQDIAHENPNASFGWNEGTSHPKWSGIRHPGRTELYLDTDLPIPINGTDYFTFANKEPFEDIGYTNASSVYVSAAKRNGQFDWEDTNGNGQHDPGEPSEPFTDTGIDPSRPDRQTAAWGYADGRYNMGNPVAEDVNSMLFRAVRWFTDRCKPDGYRLDAVKHVPNYFFGKTDDPKNNANWGYGGQIQEQFNLSRGYSDWDNHRDTVFNNTQARDDALLYGEHLASPPDPGGYIAAGMRIANDNFLNAVKGNIGSYIKDMGDPSYALFGPHLSMPYVMSHDNNYLWGGDREQAHAILLTREGIPIVYTDGYNQAGPPDWFPKPAELPFLGQFGAAWLPNLLHIRRHFARGYQASRWGEWNYLSYTRYDEDKINDDHGVTMIFILSKNYMDDWIVPIGAAIFPNGARLFNYSIYDPGLQIKVQDGGLVHMDGSTIWFPPNRYYAFSWRIPSMPLVWGESLTAPVRPIMIQQNGEPVPTVTVQRTDGRDGDPAFNPHALPDDDDSDRSYSIALPRVTSSSNLTFLARADGSAADILIKLDGGIDLNSQMSIVTQEPGTRDHPPALSKDLFLGYEKMRPVHRVCEKFAACDVARNVIGSMGAETYRATIGTPGFTITDGSGVNTTQGTADWIYHNPEHNHSDGATPQFYPPPENAAGQAIALFVKVGYTGQTDQTWIYYTTDTSNPEGSAGLGAGTTRAVPMTRYAVQEGAGWFTASIPAQPTGTEIRYKLATHATNAAARFPWTDDDIAAVPRMETLFHITNFNAATVPHYPHNDWGSMTTGLDEGFHILRTKAFLGRAESDTSIFREYTQTFYYDAARPAGRHLFPRQDWLTLTSSTYRVVVRSDMTVEEAWFRIDDMDPDNDDAATGLPNGNNAWAKATHGTLPTPDTGAPPEQQWEFDYVSIPTEGTASIKVLLREITSSTNRALSDAEGHFTTLLRTVNTGGSGLNFLITNPDLDGLTLGAGSNLTVRFSKSLAEGLTTNALADCFTLTINDTPATPQTKQLHLNATPNEHAITLLLPNFYNGNPSTLHTLKILYNREGYPTLAAQRQAYATVNDDSNNDGIPDSWEASWSLPPATLTPTGDYDGDGITDHDEYIANTNPTDPDSHFRLNANLSLDNGSLLLSFPAGVNRLFNVWQTESLSTQPILWTNATPVPIPGTGQYLRYTGTLHSAPAAYYRIQAQLPEDH